MPIAFPNHHLRDEEKYGVNLTLGLLVRSFDTRYYRRASGYDIQAENL